MKSIIATGARVLTVGYLTALIAGACGGSTQGGRGGSETNFQRCTTDADCRTDERCVAQQCISISDAGADGITCSLGSLAQDCLDEPNCVATWADASTRYPNQCASSAPSQAMCGEYYAIIWHGVDTADVYYYDKTSGVLVGKLRWVNIPIRCTAFTTDFVLPGATEPVPMVECTPLPGVDCSDAGSSAARGDGGLGALCASDLDCASTLKCCYPCGIPGCQNECMVAQGGECPLIP